MFGRPKKMEDRDALEPVMNQILADMETYGTDSPEYPALMQRLQEIVALRASQDTRRRCSPDGMLLVAGNLLGILIIVAYERTNVMTSKAVSFIVKPK